MPFRSPRYCAGWSVYQAVPKTAAEWDHILNVIATNATFRDIVISLGATYGLYLVSSLLYFEPWHMFSQSHPFFQSSVADKADHPDRLVLRTAASFVQYMLLLPSFVNILMIYSSEPRPPPPSRPSTASWRLTFAPFVRSQCATCTMSRGEPKDPPPPAISAGLS